MFAQAFASISTAAIVTSPTGSATLTPTIGKAIGLAYVPAESAAVGTALTIDVRGRSVPAAEVCRAEVFAELKLAPGPYTIVVRAANDGTPVLSGRVAVTVNATQQGANWYGVIVQWVGLEWADQVIRLDAIRHDPLLRYIADGVVASGLDRAGVLTMFIDIGTNGEVALWSGERLLVASCAAGPAFEGAQISCGMRALEGAVTAVSFDEAGRLPTHDREQMRAFLAAAPVARTLAQRTRGRVFSPRARRESKEH